MRRKRGTSVVAEAAKSINFHGGQLFTGIFHEVETWDTMVVATAPASINFTG